MKTRFFVRGANTSAARSVTITLAAFLMLAATPASAIPLVATNGTSLTRFDSTLPSTVTTVDFTGLRGGETIVGIDYRPATGVLYGVGTSGRVYTIDASTGAVSPVSGVSAVALNGTAFGTDFDPLNDRIRQVSNTEQNVRLNPDDGTLANSDSNLNPAGHVVAVAYSNNFFGTAASTLFGIDSASGQLVRIGGELGVPFPHQGQVTTIGSMGLGTNLNPNIGFDIFSNTTAFATITINGQSRLYSINLTTGAATNLGTIGNGLTSFEGLAAVLRPPVDATAYGVTANGRLFRFPTSNAFAASELGLLGFTPEGMDFRPGTTDLYALDVGPSTSQLYKIDVTNATATPVGPGFPSQVTGQPSNNYSLLNSTIGFDFNPTTLQAGDGSMRIRVVASNGGSNLRLNSNTGVVTNVDTPLSFAPGDPNAGSTPAVDAVAYINTAVATTGGTTTLYDLDFSKNDLLTQVPPNAGTLNTVGDTGVNFDAGVSFDIYTEADSTDATIGGDHGFVVLQRAGEAAYTLYEVDLATGAMRNARTVGNFGLSFDGGFAIRPPAGEFRFSSATYSVSEGAGSITVTVERVRGSVGTVSVLVGKEPKTATAGNDYGDGSTFLTFASGETSKTLSVPVIDDASVEGDETFNVFLGGTAGGGTLGKPATATVTIVDNDIPGVALATTTNFSDNDAPPGVTVRVGSTVTFEYVVTNPGNVALSGVAVSDDNGTSGDAADDFAPSFQNGDANGNALLDVGESWTFTTTRVAAAGQFSHTGRVSASPAGGGASVVASDPEHHFGIVPTVLANISTRLRVETGDRVLIGGFIISGNEDKKVLVRALGPSLGISGQLEDPMVQVYNSEGGLIAENNNWQDAPNRQEIVDSTIPPTNDLESAFLGTLAPGAYTAIVSGVAETSGIGLVEVYDLDRTVDSDLANIATRGVVETGDNVLIGGLIVTGEAQRKILIRGIGPSLTVGGKLADPTLELVNANGQTLLANDNWRDTQETAIDATTIAPKDDLESAILTTLPAANYTALLRGRDGTTGIGVVEIYAVP